MKPFPYPKTEQFLTKTNPSNIKEDNYRQLLHTFITEYQNLRGFSPETTLPTANGPLKMDLTEYILNYLLEGDEISHLTWYYTLEHQISYFSCHQALDYADLHFITLTDIIRYPVDYIDRQLITIQENQEESIARVAM